MAWPVDLRSIDSNMTTTELWALKEQMGHSDWSCECQEVNGFSEMSNWKYTIHGIVYEFTEFYEVLTKIERL